MLEEGGSHISLVYIQLHHNYHSSTNPPFDVINTRTSARCGGGINIVLIGDCYWKMGGYFEKVWEGGGRELLEQYYGVTRVS